MKTAVIICEYNPFHNGHRYQIEKLRQIAGEICVIAVMSGSFTQRGEPAVFSKYARARAAVECGASLVLELPFPYSANSAEYFAGAAVSIAHRLGVADYLCFGSESGDLALIERVSGRLADEDFRARLFALQKSPENAHLGRAALTQRLYEAHHDDPAGAELLARPNDILAVEYLAALRRLGSSIRPIAIRRLGAGHDSPAPASPPATPEGEEAIASATALRALLRDRGLAAAAPYLPEAAVKVYAECLQSGAVTDSERLAEAVLAFFRLARPEGLAEVAEITGGLNHRLCAAAKQAGSLADFFELAHTKRYTLSRIRRAVWNCLLSVTEAQLKAPPAYTQVLAADALGRQALRRMRKLADIPVLTKPADYRQLPPEAQRQADLAHSADALYTLAFERPAPAFDFILRSPYLKP